MKKSLILLSWLVALVGCKSSSSAISWVGKPQFGWKPLYAETFEIDALEGKSFKLPASIGKLEVRVNANSALYGGVFNEAEMNAIRLTKHHLIPKDFQDRRCSLLSVDKASTTCDVDTQSQLYFVVRDRRDIGTVVSGGLGLWLHSHLMAEHATLPNKVHIKFDRWQCLTNCSEPALQ